MHVKRLESRAWRMSLTVLYGILLVMLYKFMDNGLPSITNVKVSDDKNQVESVVLPHKVNRDADTRFVYRGIIQQGFYDFTHLKIIPDDCIVAFKINDFDVDLSRFTNHLCDYRSGILIDVSTYVFLETNTFEITIRNTLGQSGLDLKASPDSMWKSNFGFVFIVLVGMLLFRMMGHLGLHSSTRLIVIASVVLRFVYLSYTDIEQRTYDVLEPTGHLDYVRYIVQHHELPPANRGWEYHQPPVYYLLAAAVYKTSQLIGIRDPIRALQLLSVFLNIGFMVFCVLIVITVLHKQSISNLVVALIAFWPSAILHSSRIGNDALFYFFYSAAFYYLIKWYQFGQMRMLRISALITALTILTKANGIIVAGMTCWLMAFQYLDKKQSLQQLRSYVLIMAVLVLGFAASFTIKFLHSVEDQRQDWLVGEVVNTLNEGLMVNNNAENYLYFDLETYLTQPYTHTWFDEGGRQYFWNFLLKSSLFGEFGFQNRSNRNIAVVLSLLLLLFIAMGGITLFRQNTVALRRYQPLVLNIVMSVAVLILYRIKIPSSSNGDFRYILPVIISLGVYYGLSLEMAQKQNVLFRCLVVGSGLVFIALSVVFYVIPVGAAFR